MFVFFWSNIMKSLFFSAFLLLILFITSCGPVCSPACSDWEYCERESETNTYVCLLDKGRCIDSSSCLNGYECNTETHNCEPLCSPKCAFWEICSNDNTCEPREGYCDEETNCGNKKYCNPVFHRCEYICNPQCQPWQECNDINECIPRDGYCAETSDCSANKECDQRFHKCVNICNPQCDIWEKCSDSSECEILQGRCDNEHPCERNGSVSYTCDPDSHTCKKDPAVCNPVCEFYQSCVSENQCETAEGYCLSNNDCPNGYCEDNICIKDETACNSNSDCNSFEHCENGKCKITQGYCNLSDDCDGNEVCDYRTHTCNSRCTQSCEYWQSCTPDGNSCEDDTTYCTDNASCNDNQHCNTETHQCEYTCEPVCNHWETCNSLNECDDNPNRCDETTQNCGENQICNTENNYCEYVCNPTCDTWQICNESNGCDPDDGRCDKLSDCGKTIGFSATCNLTTHYCELDEGQNCDTVCKPWERCKTNGTCETATDRCDEFTNCSGGKYCDFTTHTCEEQPGNGCNPVCDSWERCNINDVCETALQRCDEITTCPNGQVCDSNNVCQETSDDCNPICQTYEYCSINSECKPIIGHCNEFTDCGNNKYCDFTNHTCEEQPGNGCNPVCDSWERCNVNDVCETAPQRCDEITTCPSGQTCNSNHVCQDSSTVCSPTCDSWERCVGNNCETKPNRCNENSNCSIGQVCNSQTHKCEYECAPTCDSWEECNQNNQCIVDDGRCDETTDCNGNNYSGHCDTSTHLCVEDEGNCNPKCKNWEYCSNTNECIIQPDKCDSNEDCPSGSVCNNSHVCKEIPGFCILESDCFDWQNCSNGFCEADETHCDSHSDCTETQSCNPSTHTCISVCNPKCEFWETCSDGICDLNTFYCESDSNCSNGKKCDNITHQCKNICEPACELWETCNSSNQCVLKDGSCNTQSDCETDQVCTNNICLNNCTPACHEWEECTEELECSIKLGRCENNTQCQSNNVSGQLLHCEQSTHTCVQDDGVCFPVCGFWQKCNSQNQCELIEGFCETNSQCSNGFVCNNHTCMKNAVSCEDSSQCFEWEICSSGFCHNDIGRCNVKSDCTVTQDCNTETHSCYELEVIPCNPACNSWETCNEQYGVCILNEDRCKLTTICGTLKACNINSHYCENFKDNCSTSCNPWEICLQNGCSLVFGFCNTDSDCSGGKSCSNHSCIAKSCVDDMDCTIGLCFNGFCRGMEIEDLKEKRGLTENDLICFPENNVILSATIFHIQNTGERKGFYVMSNEGGVNSEYYSSIFISFDPDEITAPYEVGYRFEDYKVKDSLYSSVYHIEHYGMSEARVKVGGSLRIPYIFEYEGCSSEFPCDEDYYCDIENNKCKRTNPLTFKSVTIPVAGIFKNKYLTEPYESSYVKGIDNGPYTVTVAADSSNGYTTTLKDANDDLFYMGQEFLNYSLPTLNGQCLSNMCPKEHWTSCNLYCNKGFKTIQINTDRDSKGDQCDGDGSSKINNNRDGDFDGDGKLDSVDNCPNFPNANQANADHDSFGDACDNDLDGDGWTNNDDNCPLVNNVNQAYTTDCVNRAPANATADTEVDVIVTRNSNGSWIQVPSCPWTCNEGYTQSGNTCVENTTGKIYEEINPIEEPHVFGAWGDACNHENDSDKDGYVNGSDNCSSIFNPTQQDTDNDGKGEQCDTDDDDDKFLDTEDNCQYVYNPYICKICECATSVDTKYTCTNQGQCNSVDVRGLETGPGKCHFYSTTLRAVRGILNYGHDFYVPTKNCKVNSDCAGSETCKMFPESNWGRCYGGPLTRDGMFKIQPRTSDDFIGCTRSDCMNQSIQSNWPQDFE